MPIDVLIAAAFVSVAYFVFVILALRSAAKRPPGPRRRLRKKVARLLNWGVPSLLVIVGLVLLCRRVVAETPNVVNWGVPSLLVIVGTVLLYLCFEENRHLLKSNFIQIGKISVDGEADLSYSRLLQARYDTLLRPSQHSPQTVGFFEVAIPNAGELLGRRPKGPEKTEFQLTVKGVDVTGLAKFIYSLAKSPAWTIEAAAHTHSDRVVLHARLIFDKEIKHQWYLEAEGDPDAEHNRLVERLIDDLIFHLVSYLKECQEEPLKTWADMFQGFPENIDSDSLRAYGVGRYHLDRYYRLRSAAELKLARERFELLHKTDPSCLEGLLCLGVILAESRREDEAISVLRQAQTVAQNELRPEYTDERHRIKDEVRRDLRNRRIELAIAGAEIRHFHYTYAHDGVGQLRELISRLKQGRDQLQNRGLDEEQRRFVDGQFEKYFFDYTELLAHAYTELSHTYGLYLAYLRHTHVTKALEEADHSVAMGREELDKLRDLDQDIRTHETLAADYWPLHDRHLRLRLQHAMAVGSDWEFVAGQIEQNVPPQDLPADLADPVRKRFQFVYNAVARVYHEHEVCLQQAVAQCGNIFENVRVWSDAPPVAPAVPPVGFQRGGRAEEPKTLTAYLSQENVLHGRQRLRHLRFQLLNSAGYTRFRMAAFSMEGLEHVVDAKTLIERADQLLSSAQFENPGHYQVWLNRGMIYLDRRYFEGEMVDVAERFLRRAVELNPKDYYSCEQLALALRRRLEIAGLAGYMRTTVEEGCNLAQEAIRLRPHTRTSQVLRAEFFTMLWAFEDDIDERRKLGTEIDAALVQARRVESARYKGCPYPMLEWVTLVRETQKLKEEAREIVAIMEQPPETDGTAEVPVVERQDPKPAFKTKTRDLSDRVDKFMMSCQQEIKMRWLARDYAAYYEALREQAGVLWIRIEEAQSQTGDLKMLKDWSDIRVPFTGAGSC